MLKYLLAFVLLGTTAQAGSIAITVTTTAPVCSSGCTKSYTIPDADVARIIAAYQKACNVKNGTNCTSAAVLQFWANSLMSNTANFVSSIEIPDLPNTYTPINPQ